jgi:hypothetical protein
MYVRVVVDMCLGEMLPVISGTSDSGLCRLAGRSRNSRRRCTCDFGADTSDPWLNGRPQGEYLSESVWETRKPTIFRAGYALGSLVRSEEAEGGDGGEGAGEEGEGWASGHAAMREKVRL